MDANTAHDVSRKESGSGGLLTLPLPANPNIFHVGEVGFEAWEDRILVIEDPFRSGYECAKCNKTGTVLCEGCAGTGMSAVVKDARCKQCNATGKVMCPECQGKGEFLVIPQQSERRPTSGTIVSVGPRVRELRREQNVLYADYVGQVMDLSYEDVHGAKQNCCLRVLRESEILCKLSGGHLDLRRIRRKVNLNDYGA